jgi:hypothetical protein
MQVRGAPKTRTFALVGMRTECINQIRGILKMYGKVAAVR